MNNTCCVALDRCIFCIRIIDCLEKLCCVVGTMFEIQNATPVETNNQCVLIPETLFTWLQIIFKTKQKI